MTRKSPELPEAEKRLSLIGTETLDSRDADPDVARDTLVDIARANAVFGGRAAVRYGVEQLLYDAPVYRSFTLLDIGAGTGDVTRYLVRRASRAGVTFQPVAVDHHRVAARLCRLRGLTAVVADVHELPFGPRSVDIAVASQLLHHLSRDVAIRVVGQLDALARYGVVIADLRRSQIAAAGIWLASFALRFHPVTRHDGIVSIRRGFDRDELTALLRQAGVRPTVRRHWGWRLVAVWRATDAHR